MFEWVKRNKPQVALSATDYRRMFAELQEKLATTERRKDEWNWSEKVVQAFAEVVENSPELIHDAQKLPYSKPTIRAAFEFYTNFLGLLAVKAPNDAELQKDLGIARRLLLYLSDFQNIDAEDNGLALDVNKWHEWFRGRIEECGSTQKALDELSEPNRDCLRVVYGLRLKYLERAVREDRQHYPYPTELSQKLQLLDVLRRDFGMPDQ